MKPSGHKQAVKAFEKAELCCERFITSSDLSTAEDAWEEFLSLVSRVYEKLKAGARGEAASWDWFGKIAEERREDPLLSYIHHARNADTHRLEELTERDKGGTLFMMVGGTGELDVSWDRGVITKATFTPHLSTPDARAVISDVPQHLRALPVIDRGVTYQVPTSHAGQPLQSAAVAEIAILCATYLRNAVSEAAQFIRIG